jgi:hypothetical protein
MLRRRGCVELRGSATARIAQVPFIPSQAHKKLDPDGIDTPARCTICVAGENKSQKNRKNLAKKQKIHRKTSIGVQDSGKQKLNSTQ